MSPQRCRLRVLQGTVTALHESQCMSYLARAPAHYSIVKGAEARNGTSSPHTRALVSRFRNTTCRERS